jgi:hypothetical protein
MPRSRDPNDNPKRDRDPERHHDPDRDDRDNGREGPHRHRAGRDRIVHLEIIERRFAGSPPPTIEAYTKALEQWHRLPGSVMRPATDINLPGETPTSSGGVPAQPPANPPATEEQKS